MIKTILRNAALLAALTATVNLYAQKEVRMTTAEYVDRYKHIAIEHQEKYGIPASITLAQGILESDSGNGRLAVEANNHFGIKCKSNWRGMTISHDDDARGECFRKYYSAEDSYTDHAEYLDSQPRYDSLFRYSETDYVHWARGLKAAGYATDPQYADKLIRIIESNHLYRFDTDGDAVNAADLAVTDVIETPDLETDNGPREFSEYAGKVDIDNYIVTVNPYMGYSARTVNGVEYALAHDGDTYESIATIFGRTAKKLRKYNDAPDGASLKAGDRVFLQRKPSRYMGITLHHTVEKGETLRDVAQRYGIRLARLAALNRCTKDASLSEGMRLRLK